MKLSALALCLTIGCGGSPMTMDAGVDAPAAQPDAGTDAATPFPPQCENINPMHCLLPWPSSYYLAPDTSTATGFRLQIPREAMPANRRRIRVDTAQFERFDGFSPSTAMVTAFPGRVDPSMLADEDHIDDSLGANATTIILDAESGERVAHFAELDGWPETDPERAPLYLRPATRLLEGHRYVVAIRNLRYMGGAAIEPSEYFRALRDNTPLAGSDVDARRAHFDEIFAITTAASIERASIIEAWDFVTASGETAWGDLVRMRDDALGSMGNEAASRMGARGLGCTIQRMEDAPSDNVWRRIHGTMTVPLYLEGSEPTSAAARMHRDAQGLPLANGTAEVPFEAQIPLAVYESVRAGNGPARLEVYGHGLFGSRDEVESGWHRDHQQRLGVVSVAVDWWGMSEDDLPRVIGTLQEFSDFFVTGERLQQSVINTLALARSFRGVCSEMPALQIPLEAGGTAPAIDTSAAYYYGNSQGGIMGGAVAGVSTEISRFVIGVTGMSYPFMIKRSVNWINYGAVMASGYVHALDRDVLMVASSSLWDLGEPATFASHLLRDPLPGTPTQHVLMQIGVGDAQVPNVSAFLEARTIGLAYLTPSPLTPWGMTASAGPVPDALAIYQIPGVSPSMPGTRSPGSDNDAHEGVRRSTAAIDQIGAFFRPDGVVNQTCDAVCDPI